MPTFRTTRSDSSHRCRSSRYRPVAPFLITHVLSHEGLLSQPSCCVPDHPQPLPQRGDGHTDGQLSSDARRRHPADGGEQPRSSGYRTHGHPNAPSSHNHHHHHPHAPSQRTRPAQLRPHTRTPVERSAQHLTAEREEPHCP